MEPVSTNPLAALEQKIASKQHANLQTFQKQILVELKAIRAALLAESQNVPEKKVQGGEDEKDKKIAQLQNQNRRLNYRITHLARNFQSALYTK